MDRLWGTIKAIFYTNTEDRHGYSQSLGILCKFYKPGCRGGRIRAHIHWNSKQRGGGFFGTGKKKESSKDGMCDKCGQSSGF